MPEENAIRKTAVEETLGISVGKIRRLIPEDVEVNPCTYSWSLPRGGRQSVAMSIAQDSIRILYQTSTGLGEAQDIDIALKIDWTECRFGGKRPWFLCPACGRRCSSVHVAVGREVFKCRTCHDLTYLSRRKGHNVLEKAIESMFFVLDAQTRIGRCRSTKKKIQILNKASKHIQRVGTLNKL